MHLLIMKALSMTTTDFEQPSDRFFGDVCQSGSRSDTAPFIEMVNNLNGFSLTHFGVEQGCTASLGKFVLAAAAAQQTDAVTAIHFADTQIV
ncbi:hypothetical protein [Candidatus Entotheonella palauensis]|uniref:hypothetical protein n=1 Tax=Candidatus Entotheonella palauensis TaxID=93172 RepID=UPI0015C461E7|nr:hypothetical protein [Candidatus Entotheonella palauensis]